MLAVDIGNTHTRIVAFTDGDIRQRRSFPTRELDLRELVGAFVELADHADTPYAWMASVVPAANALIDSAAQRAGLGRRFIRPGKDVIIPHALKTPETTGVDRLLSAFAAGERHFAGSSGSRGYVVAQCGSAATVDMVDDDGVFRGGYILPGPAMWLGGLSAGAQLPDLSAENPDWKAVAVGDNTRDALLNGMHVALPVAVASAALLINAGDEGPAGGPEGLPVAITGGWGETVLPFVRSRHVFDRDLLLHGVRLFGERQKKS